MVIFSGRGGAKMAGSTITSMGRIKAGAIFVALMAGQIALPVLAIGSTETTLPSTIESPDEPLDADALVGYIRAEVGALPATASVEDLEASVIFVLSQKNARANIVNVALDSIETDKTSSPALKQAVANIRLAMLKKKLKIGTGALPGGGGFGSDGTFYPSVGSGGSANYSS